METMMVLYDEEEVMRSYVESEVNEGDGYDPGE